MKPFTPEQLSLLEKIKSVSESVIEQHADATDRNSEFPRASMAALAECGAYGLNVPVEFGGWGQDLRFACAALDTIAQSCASTGMVYLMHLCGIASYCQKPDSMAEQLKAAAAGKHLTTLAWSERGSRSHFWAPVSELSHNGAGYSFSAEKSWVTSAGIADGYVMSAKSPGATSPTETALFYVSKESSGLSVAGPWESLGMKGNASAPMKMDHVTVRPDDMISPIGEGFPMMMTILPWFALGNSAISIGISEAATQATMNHLTGKGFEHLGSRLIELPNLRERLAKMRIATDRARAHLGFVLDAVESEDPMAQLYVLESKPSASSTAMEVTDLAMAACGGAAFSKHVSVERNFRDCRAASVMAPTSDVLHDFIGKALCGMPLF